MGTFRSQISTATQYGKRLLRLRSYWSPEIFMTEINRITAQLFILLAKWRD
jgi:hypothetical protein